MSRAIKDEIKKLGASEYEQLYVHDVYDRIAHHFSDTRYKPWPKVKAFVERGMQPEKPLTSQPSEGNSHPSLPFHQMLWIDIGCGNGKNFPTTTGCSVPNGFGFDTCSKLIDIASRATKGNANFLVADAMHMPFRSNIFHGGICIAVLHHITTVERRTRILQECARILAPGAHLLLYSWAHEQEKVQSVEQDVLVPWKLRKTSTTATVKDSKESSPVFASVESRFCHLYEKNEIEDLISAHCRDNLRVVQSYYDRENWAVICQKR
ncbi:tRNA methyltransferase [Perkinsela sp. CCAP 1560/4]|nr:tRNA methyltransferase [Perkinsela sp. CCAP 1560/4]|eukprot:KNH05605.1 tRNA methyltransferase [Perkinsela sp. CCAP 1560/4]